MTIPTAWSITLREDQRLAELLGRLGLLGQPPRHSEDGGPRWLTGWTRCPRPAWSLIANGELVWKCCAAPQRWAGGMLVDRGDDHVDGPDLENSAQLLRSAV